MDKDYIILKHEQLETEDIKERTEALEKDHDDLDKALAEMRQKVSVLCDEADIQMNQIRPASFATIDNTEPIALKTYEEIYDTARSSLMVRGLDPDDVSYGDLLTEQEIREIEHELNALLPREEEWVKNDYVVVFAAALIGGAADFIFGNRKNQLTGKGSKFAEELNKLHKHEGGAPIDFQGKGYEGGYHRAFSRGHDILRFYDGIKMFKEGKFIGVDGFVTTVNQNGTQYEQMALIDACVKYSKHMAADFCSTCSLPIPGFSFIMEGGNSQQMRNLKALTLTMYHEGFNCKNIMIQSISTISIELILRIYYGINSVSKMKEDLDIADDYSNYDQIKQFLLPGNKEKLMEMLLLTHTIVTAMNIGKIAISNSVRIDQINITEIMAVIRYGTSVLKTTWDRNDEYKKLMRNADLISQRWKEIEISLFEDEILHTLEAKEPLLIG